MVEAPLGMIFKQWLVPFIGMMSVLVMAVFILKRFQKVAFPRQNALRVTGCLALNAQQKLMLIEYAGKELLLGVSPQSIELLSSAISTVNTTIGSQLPSSSASLMDHLKLSWIETCKSAS